MLLKLVLGPTSGICIMLTGTMSLLILLFNSVLDIMIIITVVVLVKEQQWIIVMTNGIIL